ncbi:hypothetical protein A5717_11610 [Mycolicibacterium porcinum]|uniref:hypothetical protein n=1 Tax=Mycolicibacterium porcinum TaxID=39693 RepID=UPI00080B147D|nr:hypothetical protein [Mycolicibacterium porcinum]OCB14150.1 hypothetical protein A5717_11610 [Mycolicibacterium porcinum]
MTDGPALGAESAADSPEPPTTAQRTGQRRPIRYDAATATPRLQRAAADHGPETSQPERDPSPDENDDGTDNDPTPDTEGEGTGGDFADAFRANHDDLGLTPEEYQAAAEALAAEADGADDTDDTTDNEDNEPAQSVREARYRVRLRAAENEVGRLQSLVEAMRRNEIQRMAEGRLADPGDLFVDFAVHDCLDDTDTVDPARVDTIIGKCLEAHPHWAIPRQPYTGPLHSGASEQAATGSTWRDAFAPQPHERG